MSDDQIERDPYSVTLLDLSDTSLGMGNAVWIEPAEIPVLNQITGRLYSQFRFEDGEVSLAGCHLEPRMIFVVCQISLGSQASAESDDPVASVDNDFVSPRIDSIVGVFDRDGVRLSAAVEESLRLSEAIHFALSRLTISNEVSAASPQQQDEFVKAIEEAQLQKFAAANLVCAIREYWIEGKFQFRVEDQTVESPFAGWVGQLKQQPSLVQPYLCPLTHLAGKELSTDDEGDISLKNAIEDCSITGRRLLRCKLFECANSHQLASRTLVIRCTDGSEVIPAYATYCQQCGLPVANGLLGRGKICPQCLELNSKEVVSDPVDLLWVNRLAAKLETETEQSSDLPELKMVRFNQLTWVRFRRDKQSCLFVFDSQDELVAHRIQSRWRKRWMSLSDD